jgi:FKBP-type peptidyl-prolyl cis-trans isomerase 2
VPLCLLRVAWPLSPFFIFDVHKTQVIPGMEKAVLNMRIGQRKTAHLQPFEAFGDISPELIMYVPAAKIPPAVLEDMKTGQMISLTEEAQGEVIAVTPKGRSVSGCKSVNSNLSIMMGRERKRETK